MSKIQDTYVHGYADDEAARLTQQARILRHFLEKHMHFPEGSKILEAGCGVGAETLILAEINPDCTFTCLDISADSLEKARTLTAQRGFQNVAFRQADITQPLTFADNEFDHCLFCYVLEHLPDPDITLQQVSRVVKPGGSIRAIECDYKSSTFTPSSSELEALIDGASSLHAASGSNPVMGRMLSATLKKAGLRGVFVQTAIIDTRDDDPAKSRLSRTVLGDVIVPIYEAIGETMLSRQFLNAAQLERGLAQMRSAAANDDRGFQNTIYVAEGSPCLQRM